jgi:hypothetical protein
VAARSLERAGVTTSDSRSFSFKKEVTGSDRSREKTMSRVRIGGTTGGPFRVRARTIGALVALIGVATACDTGPTSPGDGPPAEFLAGGGRASDRDGFVGGLADSGPATPDEKPGAPDIYPGFPVAYYSDTNCFGEPFENVIDSESAWEEWLAGATSCAGDLPTPWPDGSVDVMTAAQYEPDQPPPPDRPTEPVDPTEPPGWGGPIVDFEASVVIAIGLEEAAGWGRHVQVADVSTTGNITHVRFEVLSPGEDCWAVLMGPFDPAQVRTAPVIAVVVPRPVGQVLAFERTEEVWHCIVEPDPTIPLTLYYTDGPCELGADEAVIRSGGAWEAWLDAAAECDFARWGSGAEPALPEGLDAGGSTEPGVSIDPPTGWLSPEVDFSTHAVLVLRAPGQTRWGGGVWLSAVEESTSGTTVDYWVITPGPDCPAVEGGASLRPTAAIRVPLPLGDPVTFRRNTETVECRWEVPVDGPDGGSGGGGSGGSGGGSTTGPDSVVTYPARGSS